MRLRILSFLLCWSWLATISIGWASTAQVLFEQGQTAMQQGKFEPAITHWQTALQEKNLDPTLQVHISVQLAATYQSLGLPDQATEVLSIAQNFAKTSPLLSAQVLTQLSDLALATRQDEQAHDYAYKSLEVLPAEAPFVLRATVLNNLGNVLAVEAYYTKAIEIYTQSIEAALNAPDYILNARASINLAYAHSKNNQWPEAATALSTALTKLERANNDYHKAFSLLSIAIWAQRLAAQLSNTGVQSVAVSASPSAKDGTTQLLQKGDKKDRTHDSLLLPSPFGVGVGGEGALANLTTIRQKLHVLAQTALNQSLIIVKALQNARLLSYAYGYLGQLYETEQRYDESLQLTRQAIFFAQKDQTSFFTQSTQASNLLYRWQWQVARLFRVKQQTAEAIAAYRSAVKSLQPVRRELALGYRNTSLSFRETVGPIFFELADLLLQRATAATRKTEKEQWLQEAQETIERLKTVELENYFRDDCVTEFQAKRTSLEHDLANSTSKVAIIYPILLPERIEILLSLPARAQLQQFTLPVPKNRLKEEVNEFRFELESNETDTYLAYAQQLYQWLIRPLMPTLNANNIETLVIVPDEILRTIPFAALHDGKDFLISRFALTTTPGLTLTDAPKPSSKNKVKILINGLAESIDGYSKLLGVPEEVNLLSSLYGSQAVTVLLNQNFTLENFTQAMKQEVYSIVHIASHGQFDSDPEKTFILTYRGKLTMNRLEKLIRLSEIRQEPLELLSLSACETAVGDDQAALGLGGLAIKAGAQSALASLWLVDDAATTQLMKEFYQQWQRKGVTKAKALQLAQQRLLKQSRYQHPVFWSSFLLIGNWM